LFDECELEEDLPRGADSELHKPLGEVAGTSLVEDILLVVVEGMLLVAVEGMLLEVEDKSQVVVDSYQGLEDKPLREADNRLGEDRLEELRMDLLVVVLNLNKQAEKEEGSSVVNFLYPFINHLLILT
jgi:hypothetical protein